MQDAAAENIARQYCENYFESKKSQAILSLAAI
jgi:hypothetical protein